MPKVNYSCAVCRNVFERETLPLAAPGPPQYETCPVCGANLYNFKPTTRFGDPQRVTSLRSGILGLLKSRKGILIGIASLVVLVGGLLWVLNGRSRSRADNRVEVRPQHPEDTLKKSNSNSPPQTPPKIS